LPEFGALSRGSLESLARHDFGWKDLWCEAPGCEAPADGSYRDHYYCRVHLREALSKRSQQEKRSENNDSRKLL
jgi:hypothetical protein